LPWGFVVPTITGWAYHAVKERKALQPFKVFFAMLALFLSSIIYIVGTITFVRTGLLSLIPTVFLLTGHFYLTFFPVYILLRRPMISIKKLIGFMAPPIIILFIIIFQLIAIGL